MTLIFGILTYIIVIVGLLALVRGAGESKGGVKAIDRFYAKHPKTALGIAILIVGLCLYAAQRIDESNTQALQQQWIASNTRGKT